MKTVILKVEIPNDAEIIGVNVQYSNGYTDDARYTEFIPPSDKEIIDKVYNKYPKDVKMRMAFKLGIVWFKSLLI